MGTEWSGSSTFRHPKLGGGVQQGSVTRISRLGLRVPDCHVGVPLRAEILRSGDGFFVSSTARVAFAFIS